MSRPKDITKDLAFLSQVESHMVEVVSYLALSTDEEIAAFYLRAIELHRDLCNKQQRLIEKERQT